MVKLLVFGAQAEELAKIKAAAAGLKLRVEAVPLLLYRQKLKTLAEGQLAGLAESVQMGGGEEVYQGGPLKESMLVMCNLSEKQMDKLLAALKRGAVHVDYKAVLTETNAKWNVLRLFAELGREKAAYEKSAL